MFERLNPDLQNKLMTDYISDFDLTKLTKLNLFGVMWC